MLSPDAGISDLLTLRFLLRGRRSGTLIRDRLLPYAITAATLLLFGVVVPGRVSAFTPPLTDANAWLDTSGDDVTVHYEVFDPVSDAWEHGQSGPYDAVFGLEANDGVVSWCMTSDTPSQQIGFAVYDPVRKNWKHGSSAQGDNIGPVSNNGGVVAWTRLSDSTLYVESAVYRLQAGSWSINSQEYTLGPGSIDLIASCNGVVAYASWVYDGYGGHQYLTCRAYDPLRGGWTTDAVSYFGYWADVPARSLSVSLDSTVYYTIDGVLNLRGYPYGQGEWNDGGTQPQAYFYAEPDPVSPAVVWFWNLSLGAVSHSWEFGDGWIGWGRGQHHTYANRGRYTVSLRVDVGDESDTYVAEVDGCIACVPVIYVDASAAPGGDGASWATAFDCLQVGLAEFCHDSCGFGPEIWVAEGTYYPDRDSDWPNGSGDRGAWFQLVSSISMYGGFPSGGGTWEQRDPDAYPSILSGDLLGNDDPTTPLADLFDDPTRDENSYLVVRVYTRTPAVLTLDGFTVTGGNSYGDRPWPGGLNVLASGDGYSTVALTGCTFTGNIGGSSTAGAIELGDCNLTATNCTFIGNVGYSGGAIRTPDWVDPSHDAISTLINCTFISNMATAVGGAISDASCCMTVANCVFTDNMAGIRGGAMHLVADTSVTNSILWNNTASSSGGEVYFRISDPYDPEEPSFAYCDVQGGVNGTKSGGSPVQDGGGNIDADPLFVGAGDVRPSWGSPCIDAADNTAVPADTLDLDHDGDTGEPLPFDLDWHTRFHDDPDTPDGGNGTPPIVDMGAYEYGAPAITTGDMDGDGDVDADDFMLFVDCMPGPDALTPPPGCDPPVFEDADLDGDGDVDLADFATFQVEFSGPQP